jgi:FkbM family methyltransferase
MREVGGFLWPNTDEQCFKAALRDVELIRQWMLGGRRQCVQAGGNCGVFPKALAAHYAEVYTFEPEAENFACLQANNMPANVRAFEAALGDSTQPIALYRTPANAGAHYVMCKGTIPQMRVDDLGLDACDLIALDVEGYELPALRGAVETIRRCKPTLVAEAKGHGARFGYSDAALERWVTALGYVRVAIIGRDRVWTLPSSG